MAVTPIYGWPTPALSEPADVPTDMSELAVAIETTVDSLDDRLDVLEAVAPAMVRIAEVVLAAPAATIDFSAIPATYRHLALIFRGRCDSAGNEQPAGLRFNGDASAIYDSVAIYGQGSSSAANEELAQT